MHSDEINEINEHLAAARELVLRYDFKHSANTYKLILEQSRNINYREGIANAAHGLANCYDQGDFPDKAIEYGNLAMSIYTALGDKQGQARCCLLLAKSYSTLGDNSQQAEYTFKGLEIAIDTKDLRLQQKFYNNLSHYYQFFLNDMEKSLEYMNISTEISHTLNDYKALLTNYCNLGIIHTYKNDYEKAMKYLHLAEDINTKYVNDDQLKSYYVMYIGTIYLNRKRPEIALQCFNESMEIAARNEFWVVYCETTMMTGQAYNDMNQKDEAVKILLKGIETAKDKKIIRLLINHYNVLSEVYESKGDFYEALDYYEKFRTTRIEHISGLNEKNLEHIKFLNHLKQSQKESLILKEKNSEMHRINELLIETDKEKNDFLGVVVHDLKNPLTNIILMAGNLKKNFEKLSPEKSSGIFEKLYLSSERMLEIIDNLLDINRIESGNIILNMKEIKLRELIQRIISEFEIYSSQKNIKIILNESSEDGTLNSDEMVVKEILMNLISNALKYSHKDSEVEINIAENGEGKKEIKISDSGLGIRDEEKAKVFQKFAKISNKPTAGENSTGLGLSIVKKLTELCGGDISFESEFGKGSTFILSF